MTSFVLEYRQKPSMASTQPTVIFAVNWLLSPGRIMADKLSSPTIFTSPSTVTCVCEDLSASKDASRINRICTFVIPFSWQDKGACREDQHDEQILMSGQKWVTYCH